MCNWFFIAKCIGHYVLDFVLANVLLTGCWLLAAFAFFFLFLLRFQKGYTDSQKNGPKKARPLYSLPPLLITWGSELTLFTTPLLIASGHYSLFKMRIFQCYVFLPEGMIIFWKDFCSLKKYLDWVFDSSWPLYPWSLTSLPLKNGGKGRRSFPIGFR